MAIAKVFKNRVLNCRVIHPDGRIIIFDNGSHITVLKKDIDYLQSLVDEGDAYVYIDHNEVEVDTEELSIEGRINKLKREAVEEFLAAQAVKADSTSDTSTELKPGSSATLLNAIASNSGNTGAPVASSTGVQVTLPAAPAVKK